MSTLTPEYAMYGYRRTHIPEERPQHVPNYRPSSAVEHLPVDAASSCLALPRVGQSAPPAKHGTVTVLKSS